MNFYSCPGSHCAVSRFCWDWITKAHRLKTHFFCVLIFTQALELAQLHLAESGAAPPGVGRGPGSPCDRSSTCSRPGRRRHAVECSGGSGGADGTRVASRLREPCARRRRPPPRRRGGGTLASDDDGSRGSFGSARALSLCELPPAPAPPARPPRAPPRCIPIAATRWRSTGARTAATEEKPRS